MHSSQRSAFCKIGVNEYGLPRVAVIGGVPDSVIEKAFAEINIIKTSAVIDAQNLLSRLIRLSMIHHCVVCFSCTQFHVHHQSRWQLNRLLTENAIVSMHRQAFAAQTALSIAANFFISRAAYPTKNDTYVVYLYGKKINAVSPKTTMRQHARGALAISGLKIAGCAFDMPAACKSRTTRICFRELTPGLIYGRWPTAS